MLGSLPSRVLGRLRAVARGSAAVEAPTPAPSAPTGWWDLLPFTAHRIALAPGLETRSTGVAPVDDLRTQLVVEACGSTLDGRTVVDLGCLEGGFTLAFAQRGAASALGIEARQQSVDRCELARTFLRLDNAEFVVADIKDELVRHAPFDVVFATGILYHVADPAAMLVSMRAACSHVALIDTHVAHLDAVTHGCSPVVSRELQGVVYRGRVFPEYPADSTAEEREAMAWAAYSDVDAFWPLEDDLVQMIEAAGFTRVEKIDAAADGRLDQWAVDHVNRVMYLAYV